MTGPPIYQADDTAQMREAGATDGSGLQVHELRDDGQPLCGRKPDRWRGRPMRLVPLGRSSVTYRRCAQITNS